MRCLHIIDDFQFDGYDFNNTHPDYFAIADYDNSLVCWWKSNWESSFLIFCNLLTGKLTNKIEYYGEEFGLSNKGKTSILKGHTSPIGYLAMSSHREFIASYSTDSSIRIWGIAEK